MINKLYVLACIMLLMMTGCRKNEPVQTGEKSQERILVIGLIPEQQIFEQVEKYTPLAGYLSKKTSVKIELKVLPRYGNIIDNFVSQGMDGAFFGSFTYALAHARLGVEILARPETLDGRSTYHGLIFVRKDSGIKGPKDMKGKRFAFVDKATTAGYLLAIDYFYRNNIRDYKAYLKEAYFAGTHEDSIHDVLDRKADIGVAKNTIFDHLAKENSRVNKELTVLEQSPRMPENGLAVRNNLDAQVKKKLKDALLTMQDDPEGSKILKNFGARRFIATTDRDYEPVLRYTKTIGLDLLTYDYLNE